MLRNLIIGIVIGIALGFVITKLTQPNVGHLQISTDSLDAVVAELRADSVRRAMAEAHQLDSIARLNAAIAAAGVRRRHAWQDAQDATQALDSAIRGDSTAQAILERQRASYEAVWAADSETIAALRSIIAVDSLRLGTRDSTIRETRRALAEALTQRDAWRRVALGPRWFMRLAKTTATVLVLVEGCRLAPGDSRPC